MSRRSKPMRTSDIDSGLGSSIPPPQNQTSFSDSSILGEGHAVQYGHQTYIYNNHQTYGNPVQGRSPALASHPFDHAYMNSLHSPHLDGYSYHPAPNDQALVRHSLYSNTPNRHRQRPPPQRNHDSRSIEELREQHETHYNEYRNNRRDYNRTIGRCKGRLISLVALLEECDREADRYSIEVLRAETLHLLANAQRTKAGDPSLISDRRSKSFQHALESMQEAERLLEASLASGDDDAREEVRKKLYPLYHDFSRLLSALGSWKLAKAVQVSEELLDSGMQDDTNS